MSHEENLDERMGRPEYEERRELPLSLLVHLWPAAMILLGIEVLFASFSKREFVMDKGAVALLFFLVFFLCLMAGGEYIMEHTEWLAL